MATTTPALTEMDTLPAEAGPAASPTSPLVAGWQRLPTPRKALLVAGALAVVALLAAAFYTLNRPDYRVLYANLSDKDGGAILAQLSQMNVPYKHAEGGRAILVPADRVNDVRMKLASQGLPKGTVTGFELMDQTKLGMTQFQERVNFQRSLEGELTRTILSLSSVADARVHLALPQQNGFFREQQKPSASVVLTLHPGRSLDRAQVAGIVHLVASSVPELDPKAVSVIDQNGTLLSQRPDGELGADARQLEYVRTLERTYQQRILDLLEPVVGRDNVRATVTADVDFSLTESTTEQHRPNQGNEPAAVRSSQTIEENAPGATGPAGVPGAATNVAPGATTAPINGPGAPVGVVGQGANATGDGRSRREQVINYEVDKTVSVTRNAAGTVRRLSAAVVINHTTVTDKKGGTSTAPLPAEQLQQIQALVREAIGFNGERGDSVNVVNAPFNQPKVEPAQVPWHRDPVVLDTARSLAAPLGLLLVALLAWLLMVRPALKMMQPPPAAAEGAAEAGAAAGALPAPGSQLEALVAEEVERPGLPQPVHNEPTPEERQLEDARRLAKENPVAVANIIKGWISGEGVPA
ncbi:MAG: flagellar basal-body MS-ring/collar protein FliF [Tepidimonas sp.]|uniref:flagellar basal-body MS-ring/collar protein FliF n=1 Tax=Tepidimonas sp. TaxID=2002775 RepID=UPI00298F144D|nr:flagellar basal-body MS-ring/collar protein FliF [Tepidimonas sp.]MCS6811213.1 flagellar basal-body MS-ring/collar protein FliF [Tepidimonas sp.]MDW8336515.1 flagellar basal-body MS-ring/collar protein FliF [Tepidimonas sp.]